MKRFSIALIAAILVCAPALSAQTPKLRNEVSASYGTVTFIDFVYILGGTFASAITGGNAIFDNFQSYGSANLEYYRVLNKTFSVGGALSWTGGSADQLNKDGEKTGDMKYSGISIMPSAKAFWFRKKFVAMYSRLALGVTLLDKSDDEGNKGFDPTFGAQVSIAGVQFGGKYLRGFMELGGGMQGFVIAGVSVSF